MKLFLAYLHLLIFLSLTATPPATAKYAKTGCSDMCGNVRIPYPFGIGADCAINQWYIIDCHYSTPYLPALNNVEVLGVDFRNQIVTISMPKISHCRNPILNSLDLGTSPFFFSKSHNKFVFEGCGTAAMMADNGSVITGCSTGCLNVTVSDRYNCFGIGCCQTAIPDYVKSYNISLSLTGENGACGFAFLVDQTLYDQGRFSNPFIVTNTSFIPTSLLWTLTDSYQVTCCRDRVLVRRLVHVFNGTPVDTWQCQNDYAPLLEDNPYLIDGCDTYENAKYAKTGCSDKCGNVRIPYPFGIGASCSVNPWYIIDCNSSTPYLPALNNLEVLSVNLVDQTVNVSMPSISYCENPVRNSSEIMGVDLGSSPFWFSESNNKFVFEGCGTAALMVDDGSVLTGCSTACHNATLRDGNNCFGIGCCQTTIPHYLKSYTIKLTGLEEEDGACGSAFLVEDETLYGQGMFSDPFIFRNTSLFPVSLMWTLTESDQITCCFNEPRERIILDMFNGTTVDTWKCYNELSSEGTPYLIDGCKYDRYKECKKCKDGGGYCGVDTKYDVDGFVFSQKFTCYNYKERKRVMSLGVLLGNVFSLCF